MFWAVNVRICVKINGINTFCREWGLCFLLTQVPHANALITAGWCEQVSARPMPCDLIDLVGMAAAEKHTFLKDGYVHERCYDIRDVSHFRERTRRYFCLESRMQVECRRSSMRRCAPCSRARQTRARDCAWRDSRWQIDMNESEVWVVMLVDRWSMMVRRWRALLIKYFSRPCLSSPSV